MNERINECLPQFLYCLPHCVSMSLSLCFPLSLCVSFSICVALPRLSQASAPPAGQSKLALHPHPQFPGASWPASAPSPSDQQPRAGPEVVLGLAATRDLPQDSALSLPRLSQPLQAAGGVRAPQGQ